MATVRDVVTRALRMTGIIGLTEDPEAAEAEHGLFVLQGIYDSMIADGMFGRLEDYSAITDYTALGGQRIFADGVTITIPDLDADGEPFAEGMATSVISNGEATNYIYINGGWVQITAIELGNEAPLSNRGADGLAALLAVYLVEAFGQTPPQMVYRRAMSFRMSLALKMGSTQPVVEGVWY